MEKVKVLILDEGDSAAVCLETSEAITCQALNAEQAFELLKEENPEVMVCNLEAPGMEVDTIGLIKQACPHVQVVVLSPKEDDVLKTRAKELGAYEVIHKPDADLLTRIVRGAAEFGRTVSKSLDANRLAEAGEIEEAVKLFKDEK